MFQLGVRKNIGADDAVEVEGGDVHAHVAARPQHGLQHRHELGRERLHLSGIQLDQR